MLCRRVYSLARMCLAAALSLPAFGQSVVSTRSGVVHFFEGSVFLEEQQLQAQFGRFPIIGDGATLRTAQGRAEILLTPGVFLRVDENSAIRMLSSDLSDTRVELLTGSGVLESAEPRPDTSVMLIYKRWQGRFPQRGLYRIDSRPPQLTVLRGEAEVRDDGDEAAVTVKEGMILPLAAVLVPDQSSSKTGDALSSWASGRSESISADNSIATHITDEPNTMNNLGRGLDTTTGFGFTYFPLIGLPGLGLAASNPYRSWGLYQPGFNSIYLPGYTYRPLLLGLPGGSSTSLHRTLSPLGGSPRRIGGMGIRPVTSSPRTVYPHTGGRAGRHR